MKGRAGAGRGRGWERQQLVEVVEDKAGLQLLVRGAGALRGLRGLREGAERKGERKDQERNGQERKGCRKSGKGSSVLYPKPLPLPLLRVLCPLSVRSVGYSDLPALSCIDAQLKAAKGDVDKLKADTTKLEGIVSTVLGGVLYSQGGDVRLKRAAS